MAGYSGKPLGEKIGLKPNHRVALLHAPPDFQGALAPIPPGVAFSGSPAAADVALLFSRTAASLDADFGPVARALAPGGMLWVAWPKKASKQPTDLTEDVVRRIGLAAGLVDVKVCAIDDVWSGLKFLRRRAAAT
jgi:hypothetical protein